MFLAKRSASPHALVTGMVGAGLGDTVLLVGCGRADALAAVAATVGLSGSAHALVTSTSESEALARASAAAGVLLTTAVQPEGRFPFADGMFRVVVCDDTRGALSRLPAAAQAAWCREARRVTAPGGRCVVLLSAAAHGVRRLLQRGQVSTVDALAQLTAAGYRPVRVLGAREGLIFVEGLAPRD